MTNYLSCILPKRNIIIIGPRVFLIKFKLIFVRSRSILHPDASRCLVHEFIRFSIPPECYILVYFPHI